jgi:hypothetical protein
MKAGGCRFRPKNSTARSKINRLALPNFGSSPEAALPYMALRSELSLYGTSSDCTTISGTASVQLLNSHVMGPQGHKF